MGIHPPSALQIRNALKVGFAGFLATGLFVIAGSEASLKAARTRVLGTLFGGLVVKLSNGWHLFGLMLGCRTC